MRKAAAQYVRDTEQRHRDRGEREIRVWVPDDDEAIEKVRKLAAKLCRALAAQNA